MDENQRLSSRVMLLPGWSMGPLEVLTAYFSTTEFIQPSFPTPPIGKPGFWVLRARSFIVFNYANVWTCSFVWNGIFCYILDHGEEMWGIWKVRTCFVPFKFPNGIWSIEGSVGAGIPSAFAWCSLLLPQALYFLLPTLSSPSKSRGCGEYVLLLRCLRWSGFVYASLAWCGSLWRMPDDAGILKQATLMLRWRNMNVKCDQVASSCGSLVDPSSNPVL